MRKLSEKSLWNAALFYLRRYSATEAQLRTVLQRKARRVKVEGPPPPVNEWISNVVNRLRELDYLNDSRVAKAKVAAWRRAGKSARAISFKLQAKGLSSDVIADVTSQSEMTDDMAIWRLARKKKLGPFRPPEARQEFRNKDLSTLARAGFSFSLAQTVVEASHPPEEL